MCLFGAIECKCQKLIIMYKISIVPQSLDIFQKKRKKVIPYSSKVSRRPLVLCDHNTKNEGAFQYNLKESNLKSRLE